jgi:hypothetical protein
MMQLRFRCEGARDALTGIRADGKMIIYRLNLIVVSTGPGGVVLAGKPKWRNWQTRYIQGVVPVREWRFESSLRHQASGDTQSKSQPAI